MQTLTVNIQDGFVQDFLNIIEHYKDKDKDKDKVQLQKDKNLEYDPYFYERQKQLQKDIKDIDSGKVEMLSAEQYDSEMKDFFTKLKVKYDNFSFPTCGW